MLLNRMYHRLKSNMLAVICNKVFFGHDSLEWN